MNIVEIQDKVELLENVRVAQQLSDKVDRLSGNQVSDIINLLGFKTHEYKLFVKLFNRYSPDRCYLSATCLMHVINGYVDTLTIQKSNLIRFFLQSYKYKLESEHNNGKY